jgi:hypothetical protein
MTLQLNPFHILNISCGAGRREIVAAADEMGFMLDAEVCTEAQNILINPSKRLSAEIGWFIDVDQQTMEKIQSCIDNNEPIPTDGLTSLSRLNAALYNLTITKSSDAYELGFSIVDIDEQFSSLDIDAVTSQINACRSQANLATVQSSDVLAELKGKQAEIRQIIAEKLSVLDQDTYISFITHIAEKYVANDDYSDGVVLSDVVDQYEVRLQSELESHTDTIEKLIEEIKEQEEANSLSKDITTLIKKVQEWDKLAQPLQLKSQASGMPHENSEHMGSEIRKLALYLHNEKGKTAEALTLVDAMKGVFAELGTLSDLFENDSDALNSLLKDQEEAKEIASELDAIKDEAQRIKNNANSTSVDRFVNRVRELNRKLLSMKLDADAKTDLRETLCYLARETAVDLHNTKHQTSYALTISKALAVEFGDIPSLRSKLNEDEKALNHQLLVSSFNSARSTGTSNSTDRSSSKSSRKGWIIGALVVIGLVILLILSSKSCSSNKASSNSSRPSSSSNQSSNPSDKANAPTSTSPSTPSSFTVTLNKSGGTGGTASVTVKNGSAMPSATAPTKTGYDFKGYYSSSNGSGTKYYDSNMKSVHKWDKDSGGTLYAYWTKKAEQKYTSNASVGDSVYIDIVSIFPEYGIYTEGQYIYTDFVCKCKTSSGSTVWVYMTCSEYKNKFDSSVSTMVGALYADEITLSPAKRIHGKVISAESIVDGLASKTGSKVIDFSSVG